MVQEYTQKAPRATAVEFNGTNGQEIFDWAETFGDRPSWSGSMNFRLNNGVLECRWPTDTDWTVVTEGMVAVLYPGSDGLQAIAGVDFYGQWEPVS